MKNLSPTLLALVAVFPTAAALDVKDDDVKLGLTLQLQVRAERGWSRGSDGNMYNIAENKVDTPPDSTDFYLRRFRIGFKGSYQGDYKFAAQLRMDNADRTGDSSPGTTATGAPANTNLVTVSNNDPLNRVPQIHVAYIERVFKQEDLGLEHSIRGGLDYAFFNGANAVFSSSSFLLPSARATEQSAFLAPRGTGIGYKLSGKAVGKDFIWGVDIQNNVSDDSASVTGNTGGAVANTNQSGEGLCYTTRLQVVPYDSEAKGHMKTVESFVGAPGTGVLVSLEYGMNLHNNTSATQTQNLKAYGFEVLGHKDGLTALVEWRAAQLVTLNTNATANTDRGSRAFIVQAGYALPMGDTWVEPAFRWSRINIDHDLSEATNYNGTDYGTSGMQTELGVNWYLNKHQNKIQFAYQNWRGEGGSAVGTNEKVASANIVRAQWQLSF